MFELAPWRTVIVDDRGSARTLIRFALERDPRFQVIGEAATGEEAEALAASADLLLIDWYLGTDDGAVVAKHCQEIAPGALIYLCSARQVPPLRPAGIGYLDKADFSSWAPMLARSLAMRAQ